MRLVVQNLNHYTAESISRVSIFLKIVLILVTYGPHIVEEGIFSETFSRLGVRLGRMIGEGAEEGYEIHQPKRYTIRELLIQRVEHSYILLLYQTVHKFYQAREVSRHGRWYVFPPENIRNSNPRELVCHFAVYLPYNLSHSWPHIYLALDWMQIWGGYNLKWTIFT
jgi:hypothetical protein